MNPSDWITGFIRSFVPGHCDTDWSVNSSSHATGIARAPCNFRWNIAAAVAVVDVAGLPLASIDGSLERSERELRVDLAGDRCRWCVRTACQSWMRLADRLYFFCASRRPNAPERMSWHSCSLSRGAWRRYGRFDGMNLPFIEGPASVSVRILPLVQSEGFTPSGAQFLIV
jgi:hypothetical protein